MTHLAGQPDDYYHYRVFTDSTITREEAINILINSQADLSDCAGICFTGRYGMLEYVHFKELTRAEQVKIAPLRKPK